MGQPVDYIERMEQRALVPTRQRGLGRGDLAEKP